MKPFKCIENIEEYDEAMNNINQLMRLDPIAGSAELKEMQYWIMLVTEYDQKSKLRFHSDPVEAVKIRIAELGLDDEQVASLFDTNQWMQKDFFNYTLDLTLSRMKFICEMLDLPIEVLMNYPNVYLPLPTENNLLGKENKSNKGGQQCAN